jgi:hypothetical protein
VISVLLSLLTAAFAAVGKLFEWLYVNRLVDAGRTQQQLEALRHEVTQAQIAVAAREAIRAAIARDPDSLPDNDPFLRD